MYKYDIMVLLMETVPSLKIGGRLMYRIKNKCLSILMTVMMIFTLIPSYTTAQAAQEDWTYAVDGNVITATCTNPDNEFYGDNDVKLTLVAEDAEYVRNVSHPATIEKTQSWQSAEAAGELRNVGNITYSGGYGGGAPTNVGTYTARVTVGQNYTATKQYEITKGTPIVTVTMENYSYNTPAGSRPTPSYTVTDTNNYNLLSRYMTATVRYTGTTATGQTYDSTSQPAQAGTYIVTVTANPNSNYTGRYNQGTGTANFIVSGGTTVDVDVTAPQGSQATSWVYGEDAWITDFSVKITGTQTDITEYYEDHPGLVSVKYYKMRGNTPSAQDTLLEDVPSTPGNYYVDVTVAASGDYAAGTGRKQFTIEKAQPTIKASDNEFDYTGETIEYAYDSITLVNNDSVDDEYPNGPTYSYYKIPENGQVPGYTEGLPKNAGNYKVKIDLPATDNYKAASVEKNVTITPFDISNEEDVTVTLGSSLIYSGNEQTQTVTEVKVGDFTFGTNDFTVTNNKATDVGDYELTVIGVRNFIGTVTKEFKVAPRNINDPAVTKNFIFGTTTHYFNSDETFEDQNLLTYTMTNDVRANGTIQTPVITLANTGNGNVNLTRGTDYVVTGTQSAMDPGTYKTTITAKGNYYGIAEFNWTISSIEVRATVNIPDWTYGDEPSKPEVTVHRNFTDITNLYSETDYLFSYKKDGGDETFEVPTEAGTYTATLYLAPKGQYSTATAQCTFTIRRKTIAVTADNGEKTYKDDDPEIGYKITTEDGLIEGDELGISAAINYPDSVTDPKLAPAGTYDTVIDTTEANPNYDIQVTKGTFKVNPKEIGSVVLDPSTYAQPAELTEVTPTFSVYDIDGELVDPSEYDAYGDLSAYEYGNYTIYIAGKNNYTSEDKASWAIIPTADVTTEYDGQAHYIDIPDDFKDKITNSVYLDTLGNAVEKPTDAGLYYFLYELELEDGRKVVLVNDLLILPRNITIDIAANQGKEYDNDPTSDPDLGFTITSGELVSGDSISLAREAGEELGEYAIGLSEDTYLTANYNVTISDDTKDNKFTIAPKNISDAKVELVNTLEYNAAEQTQEVEVTMDGYDEVTYDIANNVKTNAGEYTLTITGTGNFTGTVEKTFTVARVDIANAEVTLGETLGYNGKEQIQTVADVTLSGFGSVTYEVENNKATNAGDYELTVKGTGNFKGSVTKKFTVAPISIENAEVTLGEALTYSGAEQTQAVESVVVDGYAATYEVSNNAATNAGTYTLTVTGTGNFAGTVTKDFTIAKKDITEAEVTLGKPLTYNGKQQTQSVTGVKIDGLSATFNVSNNKVKDAGTYTLTVTGNGNFTGTASKDFIVAKKDITGAEVTLGEALTYLGAEQAQAVESVVIDDLAATYEVSDNAATDAGTYTLTVTGTENFTGTVTKDFTIAKLNIENAEVTLGNALTYTGEEQTQTIKSVTVGDLAVTYDVANNKATKAGNYELTITGTGNFEGTIKKAFSVAPKKEAATIEMDKEFDYTGKAITPELKVKDKDGKVIDSSQYTVTYANNKKVGTATVKITFKDNYTGTIESSFVIFKEDVKANSKDIQKGAMVKATGKTVEVAFGDVKNAAGFDVFIQKCSKKFKTTPTKTITGKSNLSTKISKLQKNGNFKCKIKAFKFIDGKKKYIATSEVLHFAGYKNKKYTNAKKIKLVTKSFTLTAGQKAKIKAKTVKVSKKKKLLSKKHARRFRYMSSNTGVAKVTKYGNIKAVAAGNCEITVIAQNGVSKKVKVTVK